MLLTTFIGGYSRNYKLRVVWLGWSDRPLSPRQGPVGSNRV